MSLDDLLRGAREEGPEIAADALVEAAKPRLQRLIKANTEGHEALPHAQRELMWNLVEKLINEGVDEFREAFLKYHDDKVGCARQIRSWTHDLKQRLSGEAEFRGISEIGYQGMTADAVSIARRAAVSVASWKIATLGRFFERNWGESLRNQKNEPADSGSGTGCAVLLLALACCFGALLSVVR